MLYLFYELEANHRVRKVQRGQQVHHFLLVFTFLHIYKAIMLKSSVQFLVIMCTSGCKQTRTTLLTSLCFHHYSLAMILRVREEIIIIGDPIFSETPPAALLATPILSSETPILSSETPIFSSETPIFSPKTPIFSSETPIFSSENPIFSLETLIFPSETPIF